MPSLTGRRIAHGHPFDPTYGYALEELLAVTAPPAPDRFDAFWRALHAEAREVDVAPRIGPLEGVVDGMRISAVSYRSLGGVRIGGWLVVPEGPIERGLVIGHGYAGRSAVEAPPPVPGAAVILPCARGLGARSRVAGIPDDPAAHVLHGIEARDRYVHGGCVADVWCAASALLELFPSIGPRLGYSGISFGGGIGALALAWDARFAAAHLALPSFGHHPLRLTLPCVGSGEAVRRHCLAHSEARDVLGYFDSATAATRITIPTLLAAALCDPAVPPPGQFAVYNALAGPRDLVVLSAGHFEPAAEERSLFAAQADFLARHLGGHR